MSTPGGMEDNFIDCTDIMFALRDCREDLSFMKRQFGCNNLQDQMNKCLHSARLQRRANNNLQGRQRAKVVSAILMNGEVAAGSEFASAVERVKIQRQQEAIDKQNRKAAKAAAKAAAAAE
ncbi:uncharacterized protein V1516DRAFT_662812 [Lipomyces oligophaga]|uniref:uncharacterized protein n=1 Tax=Lipomyces oligophaga TaxID=45792 RepID=UPI0034CFEEF1